MLRISRTLGLARATVRKYAGAETFPERAIRVPGSTILDPFLEYLAQTRQVHRWLQTRRAAPAPSTPRSRCGNSRRAKAPSPAESLPSPKQLAWLCVQPQSALNPSEVATLARIEQDEEAARVVGLARRFGELMRERGVTRGAQPVTSCATFEQWLSEARICGVRAVETFAAGLEQDGSAVRAALTTPWSNAQSEGQITKLKLLRRQMYGRASFDLLRRRALLAA